MGIVIPTLKYCSRDSVITISGMLQQLYTKPLISMFPLLIPFVLIPEWDFFNSLQSLDKGKITSVQGRETKWIITPKHVTFYSILLPKKPTEKHTVWDLKKNKIYCTNKTWHILFLTVFSTTARTIFTLNQKDG